MAELTEASSDSSDRAGEDNGDDRKVLLRARVAAGTSPVSEAIARALSSGMTCCNEVGG